MTVSEVEWIEVHAGPRATATVVGRAERFDFAGEVRLADLRVAPRARSLRDGWIVVTGLDGREITPGREIVGTSVLPKVVGGASVESKLRCADVTLDVPAWTSQSAGKLRELKRGSKGALRESPLGSTLGQLDVAAAAAGKTAPMLTVALEERGAAVKLALRSEDAIVEAWTEGSVTAPLSRDALAQALAAQADKLELVPLASLSGRPSSAKPTCSLPIPIYVRDDGATSGPSAGRIVVGSLRGREETFVGIKAGDEAPLSLGGQKAAPFVLATDLQTTCNGPPDANTVVAVAGKGLVSGASAGPQAPPVQPPALIVPPQKGDAYLGATTMTVTIVDADRTIAAMRPRFRQCYRAGLAADPNQAGKVTLQIVVAANGDVSTAKATSNTGLAPAVVTCLESQARRLTFSPTVNGGSLFLPLTFTAVN